MVSPEIILDKKGVLRYSDELFIKVEASEFKDTCLSLHKSLPSPVMMLFAVDERRERGVFVVNAVFVGFKRAQWVIVSMDIPQEEARFKSLAKDMYSAMAFERQILEMFGIEPEGNPDPRRLSLHDEVWPKDSYPLRKDFTGFVPRETASYKFAKVEGEGIFEVPVGPVHAGIIGPGHFRFSVAGEPIINLEIRLGFAHRGVEKLFEGKSCSQAASLAECVSGDSSFAHSLAFALAAEKISGVKVPHEALRLRAIFLELERMYNHVNDAGGIALDVGFSFPSAYASVIKEKILQLNDELTGSRYLKGINKVGGVSLALDKERRLSLYASLERIEKDFKELSRILESSVSFMDRVDSTGVLKKKTAQDLGVVGLVARACGIPTDLRKYFPDAAYREAGFRMAQEESGDVLARLRVRCAEFAESIRIIRLLAGKLDGQGAQVDAPLKEGSALGYAEGWRGPVLYWLKTDTSGLVQRCKVVDPSFHNWQGLSFAVLGNIIPDFPLCNKSFDLSYSGNDL